MSDEKFEVEEKKLEVLKYPKHKREPMPQLPLNFGEILSKMPEDEKVVHCSTLQSNENNEVSEDNQSR